MMRRVVGEKRCRRASAACLFCILSASTALFGQAASSGGKPIPAGFRSITLGMELEQVKQTLQSDALYRYRGDPDVSFLPQSSQSLIECEGNSYVRRAYFQFIDSRLSIMIIVLDDSKLDHYALFSALSAKYGEPFSLSPKETVWQSEQVRFSLEKPLMVKYIDRKAFAGMLEKGGADRDSVQLSREQFIEQF